MYTLHSKDIHTAWLYYVRQMQGGIFPQGEKGENSGCLYGSVQYTDKKENKFSSYLRKFTGIGCKVIYD